MKKTKVKKIKEIPKYSTGTFAAMADKSGLQPGKIIHPAAVQTASAAASKDMAFDAMVNKLGSNGANGTFAAGGSGFGGRWGQFGAAATAGGKMLMNAFGVKDNSSAGVTLNKSMEGAEIGGAIMPGWGHLIGGVAGGLIGGFSGAKFDESLASTTGNAADWVTHGGIFNDNYDEKVIEANTYQNSLVGAERTSQAQLEWANDPANQGTVSTLKEGGIVPGEHYASRNEVEVDANGNNAVRYKWDPKGKDTYHIMFNPDGSLTEGNMIFNDEGVRRPDGTKYSDTADKMIKNIKDPKLRKISLKKLAAEQEQQKEKEGKTKNGIPAHAKGGIQWNDLAYQTAAMLTPLLDKEKPEKTLYQVPTAKYLPTYVNVDNQIRAINDSNAITRYNMSNISPNTGAGMAYGLQAASNRAKQLSDVYAYKTNAQNELIGKNVGIYNNWSNINADIMNKVHESDAANRAAARNINRQNRASALKAWGQINSDSNKRKMDKLRIAVAAPMFKYGMENYDEMVKMLTDMGLWQ